MEPLLLEETTQRQPSMLGEDARVLRTPVPDPCVYADRLIRPRVHTRDDGRRCRADQKHGGEVGDDRLGDRIAEGPGVIDGWIALRSRPVYIRVQDLGDKAPRDTYAMFLWRRLCVA